MPRRFPALGRASTEKIRFFKSSPSRDDKRLRWRPSPLILIPLLIYGRVRTAGARVCGKTATRRPKIPTYWTIVSGGHGMPCPYDRGITFSHRHMSRRRSKMGQFCAIQTAIPK